VPALAYDTFPFSAPPAPSVTAVSPSSGPIGGSTVVTITGQNFSGVTGVSFGGTAAAFSPKSSTRLTATSPATSTSGTVTITVTTLGGPSPATADDQFTYLATP
jgi:IPT/TIG domain